MLYEVITLDNVVTALASVLSGIPDYVYAIVIILVAGVQLELFNVGDMRGVVDQGIDDSSDSRLLQSFDEVQGYPYYPGYIS